MKKLISVLLLMCMLASYAASVTVATGEKETKPTTLTFDSNASSYFTGANSTNVSIVDDETESGHSVKFELQSYSNDPYVYFNVKNYVQKLGLTSSFPTADNVKYIILKVKQEFCSSNMFVIYFSTSASAGPNEQFTTRSSFDEGQSDWQYVIFDMSKSNGWTGTIINFRLDWMASGNSEGESICINEIIFAKSDEEAEQYKKKPAGTGEDLHAMTKAQQQIADYILANVNELAPEVSNTPVTAEYEDSSLVMWFDHAYYKTPGQTVTSNGKNTYQIRLAKNEIECAQMVLASATAREDLTVEVSDFVNGSAKLTPRLYYGFYFDDVEDQSIVDPIPLLEGPISLTANKSQMFLIKVKTDKDTPAGQYKATLTVKDKDGKEIKKAYVYAYVWDFTLPESPTAKALASVSWWNIYAADPSLYNGDDGLAYRNYYDTLLENNVNAYNLPYVSIKEEEINDAKVKVLYYGQNKTERNIIKEYLDNPKVQAFNPLCFGNDNKRIENIQTAYNFLSEKEEWLEKAYFYTVDEPMTKDKLDETISDAKNIKSIFGENYKLITPMHWNSLYDREYKVDAFEYVKGYVNVWCPHTFFYNTYADKQANPALTYRGYQKVEKNIGTFTARMAEEQANGNEAWWYVTRFPHTPEIALSIDDKEVDHRILFWQQKLYNVDGFLYYEATDWYGAGSSEHNWGWNSKHEVDTGTVNPYNYYGNGVLLYHGGYLGKIHDCVESIRLESIRDGVEDYDYFVLLDKKYGEGTSDVIIKMITTSLGNYKSDDELFANVRTLLGNLIANDNITLPKPECTVKFVDYDGTTLSETTYNYGDKITAPTGLTRESDAVGSYSFRTWDAGYPDICTDDVTYKAVYDLTYADYTVRFLDYDGKVLSTKTYHYGAKITSPKKPTRKADEYGKYTFKAWNKEISTCTGNEDFTAVYDIAYTDYTVKFLDYDGTVLSEQKYHYDDKINAPEDPTRKADNVYTYTFKGWDEEVANCKGNEEFTAVYDPAYIDYTVKFLDYDGKVLSEQKYHYGDKINTPEKDPTRKADEYGTYTFKGWDKKVESCTGSEDFTAVYDIKYTDYTVKFLDYDGKVLSEKTYHYDDKITVPEDPAREADEEFTYEFTGWDKEVTVCKGSEEFTAVYGSTPAKTVIPGDMNGDGEADNKDVVSLFRYVSGTEKLEDESIYDFNGDKEVNNKDVVELFRYLSAK